MNPHADQLARYEAQMQTMLKRAKAWRAANADREVKVQFNFPKDITVITTIADAIKRGYVSVNDAGDELVKSLWPQNVPDEPTVLMVRVVLEWEEDKC